MPVVNLSKWHAAPTFNSEVQLNLYHRTAFSQKKAHFILVGWHVVGAACHPTVTGVGSCPRWVEKVTMIGMYADGSYSRAWAAAAELVHDQQTLLGRFFGLPLSTASPHS